MVSPAAVPALARAFFAARSNVRWATYVERVPIKWNHLIDNDSLKLKELEHVLIEKVEQLFQAVL